MRGLAYLLLFLAPQILVFLYLRERLPDDRRPRQARAVRMGLAVVFLVANLPWLLVAERVLVGRFWSIGRIPYIAPFVAWQMLGWVFCALVAIYVLLKAVGRYGAGAVRWVVHGPTATPSSPPPADAVSRRQFLAKGVYTYFGAGAALSAYGIWSAERQPEITRRTLAFPDLPSGLEGLTILHLSDVHAGIHMEEDRMRALVAQARALDAELVVQTGDMIDISARYVPLYVRAFRDLTAPLGVVTVIGNHDRYTGEDEVINGVRDAGQVFVRNGAHLIERNGAVLALLGIDDPRNWRADDPQERDVRAALRAAPPEAFKILLAHRPGAFDSAAPAGIPLTLAGHIHGGQFYIPGLRWSAGSLITKYVMGLYRRGRSQLYVSRGIGVVGVPIRVFAPPELVLLTLRRG
ncbi:MAG TPA: metallophosphoesterase [Gemmatimonadales bacterium]|nr:metallophosphoesterase [Gemmatimonadales bacterium]